MVTTQISPRAVLADYLSNLSRQRGFDLTQANSLIEQFNEFLLTSDAEYPDNFFVDSFVHLGMSQEEAILILRKASFELARTIATKRKMTFSSIRGEFAKKLPKTEPPSQKEEVETETSEQIKRLAETISVDEDALNTIAQRMLILLTQGIEITREDMGHARTFHGMFINLFRQAGLSDTKANLLIRVITREIAQQQTNNQNMQQALMKDYRRFLRKKCL